MFGFSGNTGFGQPAQQPAPAFGTQPASPFGASFGQPAQPAASPFGATTGSAPLFGTQSPAPAFGQAAPVAAPAFGATTSTTGFGAGAFGAAAKPSGFGGFGTTTTAAPNPFGAPAQTPGAFGAPAQSAPAFGAGLGTAPSFGATLTSTPAFGATSAPAFGAQQSAAAFGGFGAASAPAFGTAAAAPANPFGATTTGFGATAAPAFGTTPAATGFGAPAAGTAAPFGTASTNLFGNPSAAPSPFGGSTTQPATGFGGFGAAPATGAATSGTRNVPYTKTKDTEVGAGQPPTYLVSISALPNFQPPQPAKSHEELRWEDYQEGVKNQSAGPAPAAAGAFGASATAPAPFGGFGSTTQTAATGFGTSAPANPFGAPASTPAFGTTTSPAFGTTAASQPSLFGTTSAPATASNPFSGAATTAPAFGGFGAAQTPASQPSLFGPATTTGFGTAAPFGSTTPFGGASSASSFSFNSSPSTFGAASAPATGLFGTAPASSPFGGTTGTLGAVGSPFGGASSAAAFGTSTFGTFGTTTAKPASPFGTTVASPFGSTAPAATGSSLFGTTPFNFNSQPASSPSLFGNTAGGTGMSFISGLFGTQPAAPVAGTSIFGVAGAAPAAPAQPPTVAQPAYGSFGSLPAVPEVKVGITTRMPRNTSISSGKASPLLSLRPTPMRYGASVRVRAEQPSGLGTSAGALSGSGSDLLAPMSSSLGSSAAAAAGGTGLLPLRQNPHRLFITAPPPSTEAAGGACFLTPARPPSVRRGTTPDGGVNGVPGDDFGHVDAGSAETPEGRQAGAGADGYMNGAGSSGAAAAAAGANTAAAAGRAGGPGFQDSMASEPHLPRLGRLASEGYTFTPSVDELRMLHKQNPENLAAVSNFTVTRAGLGKVRWVVPVDVRGLALDKIMNISFGSVECYPDESVKPSLGQGLNKPAEITLYGVYRKDKATGAFIKEGPRGQAYEKTLREMCGRNSTKFISYKLDGGVWKFEVEHFSRYGLCGADNDDDDEEEEAEPVLGGVPGSAAAAAGEEEGVDEAGGGKAPGGRAQGGRGLAGLGLRGFAFNGAGASMGAAKADSAALRTVALAAGEDSGMEPSVGLRWQQRPQGVGLHEAEGTDGTGITGAGADQDMSDTTGPHRAGGEEITTDGEVSDGMLAGPEMAGRGGFGASKVPTIAGMTNAFRVTKASAAGDGTAAAPVGAVLPAAPLQYTLPSSLAQNPMRLRALHDTFLGGGAGGGRGHAAAGGGGANCAASAAGGRGALGKAAAATAVTSWRRSLPALAPGSAAAVMARGGELQSEAPDGAAAGAAGASGGGSGMIEGAAHATGSLALTRPVMTWYPPVDTNFVSLAIQEVRTAQTFTDAGLTMGRSFRVGWGPNGTLAMPGLSTAVSVDGRTSVEVSIIRVPVEGKGASYGSGISSEDTEVMEALRDRLRNGLEVQMQASRMYKDPSCPEDLPYWGLVVNSSDLGELVRRHVLVCQQQLQQLSGSGVGSGGDDSGGGSGGDDSDHPDAPRLRHETETWRLMEVLFSSIEGEVLDEADVAAVAPPAAAAAPLSLEYGGSPDASDDDGSGGGVAVNMRDLTPMRTPLAAIVAPPAFFMTPSDQMMDDGDDSGGVADAAGGADPDNFAARAAPRDLGRLLAVLKRRAGLSMWLQRQAKSRVKEDLLTASSPAQVTLQLLAAHQLAAATGAAVAVGDPRLAMLIARAGSRDSARKQLAAQLEMWQQAGLLEHMAPERRAAYQLLAGKVLETQRLMGLDWRRLLGLYLWYGIPNTKSSIMAVSHFLRDFEAEPDTVPYPAPYYMEGRHPSATGAQPASISFTEEAFRPTDLQWELLHLWGTTPAAATAEILAEGQEPTAMEVSATSESVFRDWLERGGLKRLLRCAGYSPNPLEHSLAWYLMTTLQALNVLPTAEVGTSNELSPEFGSNDGMLPGESSSYNHDLLATTLEFISQLQLTGGLCEWAVFVALTIPNAELRTRVVQELLALTVPEWTDDSSRREFFTMQLGVPEHLLAAAQATWAKYKRDDCNLCAALVDANDIYAAHDVFMNSVGPALFLKGAWAQLADLVYKLHLVAGEGLYARYLNLFQDNLRQGETTMLAVASAAVAEAQDGNTSREQQLHDLAQEILLAKGVLDVECKAALGLAEPDEEGERSRLLRRLVLGRMSATVHTALMEVAALPTFFGSGGGVGLGGGVTSATELDRYFAPLQSCLALQSSKATDIQLGSVAVAVAAMGARVACTS